MSTDPIETAQSLRTRNAYGMGAIAFHWTMFLLVVVVGILGVLHDDWSKETQGFRINFHALLGLLLWFTLFARIFWRFLHAPPALPAGIGALARHFASLVHWALYALMFLTPILGIVTFLYHGGIFDFGFFRVDFGVTKNPAIFRPTEDIHDYLAYALFALAGVHASVALWHQFYLHDGLLRRMWPRKRAHRDYP